MNQRRCSNVPEIFPHILKTYAKDALRTQPYDLLSWSAAYFRCIADNLDPPTKRRHEEVSQSQIHSLTIEYLRVLVKQIGKGYFVERNILQNIWRNLSLPEDELQRCLTIGGMFHWKQVHWLKLVSVLAATLCENLKSSLTLICELLTENAPGELTSIPFWMFSECYVFLAQLDGTTERVVTSDSSVVPVPSPIEIDASHFRLSLFDEWKKSDGAKTSSELQEPLCHMMNAKSFSELLAFVQNYDRGEAKSIDPIEPKVYIELMREIGAPWSWINEFISLYRPQKKSFNFRECYHTETVDQHILRIEPYECSVADCKGIGVPVQQEKIESLLTYLQSNTVNGLIDPTLFEDAACPPIE